MMQGFDVVIVGAGMVGLTLAAALKNSKLNIALIDAAEFKPVTEALTGEESQSESRVSAINLASQNILKNLGAWQTILDNRASAYSSMHVWQKDSAVSIDFDAHSHHLDHLGYIVENTVVQGALYEQVQALSNISIYESTRCKQLFVGEQESWLSLDDGSNICAKLLVACDGANSWLRKQANIPLSQYDYNHSALVATVRTELKHQHCARQVFLAQGPLALLPLKDENLCSIVWSLPPDKAKYLSECDAVEFNKALNIAFDQKLGWCELKYSASQQEISRRVFPLKMRYARQFVKNRIVLCGDAAHTIHPLAGLGANLGLQDAAALAEIIQSCLSEGKDIGASENLRAYERWRKAEASKLIVAMEAINTGFRTDKNKLAKCINLVAKTAMSLAQNSEFIKSILLKQALGYAGKSPQLTKSK